MESNTVHHEDDEISLLALGTLLLRRRRIIIALTSIGTAIGLGAALFSHRMYSSTAVFIPQTSDVSATSGLALAASQLGIRVPTTGGSWGPAVYVELLDSRGLLMPIALDTLAVPEEGGARIAVMDLLDVDAPTPALRAERTIKAVAKLVDATEDKKLAAVKLTVHTRWPSVSLALANQLVREVNEFNLESRKSQATAERVFVEGQAADAERALRDAEDRLQTFLQENRSMNGAPHLDFEHDRLQREVSLRQQLYTTLMQNREEARIREVRDTPVITPIEDPQLPIISESRGVVIKTILGFLVGGFLGIAIAFIENAVTVARRAQSEESREFFQLVSEATPRFRRIRSR